MCTVFVGILVKACFSLFYIEINKEKRPSNMLPLIESDAYILKKEALSDTQEMVTM